MRSCSNPPTIWESSEFASSKAKRYASLFILPPYHTVTDFCLSIYPLALRLKALSQFSSPVESHLYIPSLLCSALCPREQSVDRAGQHARIPGSEAMAKRVIDA